MAKVTTRIATTVHRASIQSELDYILLFSLSGMVPLSTCLPPSHTYLPPTLPPSLVHPPSFTTSIFHTPSLTPTLPLPQHPHSLTPSIFHTPSLTNSLHLPYPLTHSHPPSSTTPHSLTPSLPPSLIPPLTSSFPYMGIPYPYTSLRGIYIPSW